MVSGQPGAILFIKISAKMFDSLRYFPAIMPKLESIGAFCAVFSVQREEQVF